MQTKDNRFVYLINSISNANGASNPWNQPRTEDAQFSSNPSTHLTRLRLLRLTLALRLVAPNIPLALRASIEAVVRVRRLVAHVRVNPNQLATVHGRHALHGDGARAVAAAVAARAVHLAVVLGVEVLDVDRAAAVVLDHFIRGVEGSATGDVGCAVALDADGVFAHVFEPQVLERARAQAVDALALVGADDHVAQGGAVFEDEDGVGFAAFALAAAGGAAVVLDECQLDGSPTIEPALVGTYFYEFAIEGLAAGNVLRLAQRLRAGGSRERGLSKAGESGGQSCQEGDEAGGVHVWYRDEGVVWSKAKESMGDIGQNSTVC
jgi:hypothetical protein